MRQRPHIMTMNYYSFNEKIHSSSNQVEGHLRKKFITEDISELYFTFVWLSGQR